MTHKAIVELRKVVEIEFESDKKAVGDYYDQVEDILLEYDQNEQFQEKYGNDFDACRILEIDKEEIVEEFWSLH